MLRARYTMLFLLPAIFAGYAACGGEDASEDTTAEELGVAEAESTTQPMILGTFRDEGAHSGIAVLTLKRDSTYHLEEGVECIRAPCDLPEMNGQFRMGTKDGSPVLVLTDENPTSAPMEYLRYKYTGDTLYVAPVGRFGTWQALKRTNAQAWCAAPNDCALQDLPIGPCAGQWTCPANACRYACGPVSCEMENTCSAM